MLRELKVNEMTKLVLGVGFNDKTRPANVDGKSVKEYQLWQDMLCRCFSEKLQTHRPTYRGCNVSDNFLNYTFLHSALFIFHSQYVLFPHPALCILNLYIY